MTDALAKAAVVSEMIFAAMLLFSAKQALAKRDFRRVAFLFAALSLTGYSAWLFAGQMSR
jgi:hypothetical protein